MERLKLTQTQAKNLMRDNGIPVSNDEFRQKIIDGVYPFAEFHGFSEGGNVKATIYAADFYEWLKNPSKKKATEWTADLFAEYLADPANAIHLSKWMAERVARQ